MFCANGKAPFVIGAFFSFGNHKRADLNGFVRRKMLLLKGRGF